MMKLPRDWINRMIDNGYPVQAATTCSNACYWVYLTTSGKVCRREYNFEEDCDTCDGHDRIDIAKITYSSIGRLNRALENLSNY